MTLAGPAQVTGLIADVFDRLKIPYFVGGSLASSLHGIPRTTQEDVTPLWFSRIAT